MSFQESLFYNAPFMLSLTMGSFLLGTYIFKKSKISLLHPIFISMICIISFLNVFDIPYEKYAEGSAFINFMLGPAVVSLGVILYDQMKYLKGNVLSILTAIAVGSVIGVTSVIALGKLFGLDDSLIISMEPKSVTTPIALGISQSYGGNTSLTAVTVVICGMFGAMFGPKVLSILKIKSPVAQGLSIGAASHGLGTARAMEIGAIEGAVSGLSIGLMGVMTSIAVPLVHWIYDMLI